MIASNPSPRRPCPAVARDEPRGTAVRRPSPPRRRAMRRRVASSLAAAVLRGPAGTPAAGSDVDGRPARGREADRGRPRGGRSRRAGRRSTGSAEPRTGPASCVLQGVEGRDDDADPRRKEEEPGRERRERPRRCERVGCGPNRPPWNRTRTIGTCRTTRPTLAGTVTKAIRRSAKRGCP